MLAGALSGVIIVVLATQGITHSVPRDMVTALPSPAGQGSALPRLSLTAEGHVLLSWLEPVAGGGGNERPSAMALDHARLDGATVWSRPSRVMTSDRLFVNWADVPGVREVRPGQW